MSLAALVRARGPRAVARARAVLELVRWGNCLALAMTTVLGAHLAGGLATSQAVIASSAVVGLHASGTALNDRCDVAVDTLARAKRPLPSGRLSMQFAERLTVVLAAVGLCLAALLGTLPLLIAVLVALASLAYDVRLKSTILLGNVIVATLAGTTMLFGAMAVDPRGPLPESALRGGLLILLYMLAYEILKCLQDMVSDARSGIRTIATQWGPVVARGMAAVALAGFGGVAAWPVVTGATTHTYRIAVLLPLGCAAGAVVGSYVVTPQLRAWDFAVGVLKAGWFVSLPTLFLLR